MFKNSLQKIATLVLIFLLLTFGFWGVTYAAWQNPIVDPTGGNTDPPINVSGSSQVKDGTLWLGGDGYGTSGFGLLVEQGNVGIGETSPESLLHLVTGNDAGLQGLKIDSDGDSDDIPFRIRTDTAGGGAVDDADTKFIVEGGGDVGIGSTTPETTLVVDGGVGGEVMNVSGGIIRGLGDATQYSDALSLGWAQSVFDTLPPGNSGETIRHNGTNWVANNNLYNDGTNVGIGKDNPGNRLNVLGISSTVDGTIVSDVNIVTTFEEDYAGADSFVRLKAVAANSGTGNAGGIGFKAGASGVVADNLLYLTADTQSNVKNQFVIEGNGNVGIGTTGPGGRLTITTNLGSVADENILELREGANPAYGWYWTLDDLVDGDLKLWRKDPGASEVINFARGTGYVTFSDNVGIGTDDPSDKLHIFETGEVGGLRIDNDSTASQIRLSATGGGLADWIIGADNAGGAGGNAYAIYDAVNSAYRMVINNSGYVGINTVSPEVDLEVIGSVNIGDFSTNNVGNLQVKGDGGNEGITIWNEGVTTYRMWIDEANDTGHLTRGNTATAGLSIETNGNVGIGTADPEVTLHVEGDVKITGVLTLTGSDVAEEFVTDRDYPVGTVLVMADFGYKSARACTNEYDTKVVGVVSDNASLIMGKVDARYKEIVAMVGVIKVKANNINGIIKKGDLLTTSSIYGQAQKAINPKVGTIIGKALEDLNTREGEIMALVNLQ